MTQHKRNFIPLNQKSIESSNAVSFGAYRENSIWKSTGDYGNFLIEFDEVEKSLVFYTSNNYVIDTPITWKEIFRIDRFGISRPTYGKIFRPVDFVPIPDGRIYNVSANDNNIMLRLYGESYIHLYNKDLSGETLPIGFNFTIVNTTPLLGVILPEDDVVIYGSILGQIGNRYRTWTKDTHRKPIGFIYTPAELEKISATEWLLNGLVSDVYL